MKELIYLIIIICVVSATKAIRKDIKNYGYDGSEGPNSWGTDYQQCVGKHQSPINIEEHLVEVVDMIPISYNNFSEEVDVFVTNNGHTVEFRLNTSATITGGPLLGTYRFFQMHFHWGATDNEGSENRINNNSFPMEAHLVFFEQSYGSFDEAISHPDGLCVLSFLYSKTNELNENYFDLINSLNEVKDPGTEFRMAVPISLEALITSNRASYYTYGGSLTTPPCLEVVTWIEYRSTIPLAHIQMEAFRRLKSQHGNLTHNYRPTQQLHGRKIKTNRDVAICSSISCSQNVFLLGTNAVLLYFIQKMWYA